MENEQSLRKGSVYCWVTRDPQAQQLNTHSIGAGWGGTCRNRQHSGDKGIRSSRFSFAAEYIPGTPGFHEKPVFKTKIKTLALGKKGLQRPEPIAEPKPVLTCLGSCNKTTLDWGASRPTFIFHRPRSRTSPRQ